MKPGKLYSLNKSFSFFTAIYGILCLFTAYPALAGEGTTGAKTLEMTPSARALGMGGVFTAIANDISAIYYNPAGLSILSYNEIYFMNTREILGINTGVVSISRKPNKFGAWGLSVLTFNGGDADIYFENGSASRIEAQQDTLGIVSFSPKISRDGAVGINIKSLKSELAQNYAATAFAVDIGILIGANEDFGSTLGITLQNIDTFGNGIKYIEVPDKLPMKWRAGGAKKTTLFNNPATFGVDITKLYYGDKWNVHLGIESFLNRFFAVRMGYRYGYDFIFASTGVGIKIGRFNFDIGSSLIGTWGWEHQVSLNVKI